MPRSRKKPAKKAAAKGAKAKVQNLDAEEEPEIITVARAARLTPVEAVMVCAGFMSSLAALLTERAVEDIKNYAEEEGVAMTEERAKAQATEEVARILGATRGEEPCDAVQRHAAASGRWLVDALRSAAPRRPGDAAPTPPEDVAAEAAAYALNDCTNLDLEHIAAFCGLSILLGGAEGDAREHAICACSAFAAAPEAVDALLAWFALTPRIGRTEEPPEGPHPWSDLFLGDDGTPAVPELFDYVLSDTPATVAASAHLPGFLDRLLEFVFLSFEDPNPPGVAGLAAKYDGRWNLSPVGSRGYVFLSLYRRAALDGPPPPRLRSCMACGRDEVPGFRLSACASVLRP
ncbi:hypothetical protein JL721_6075 [Aureococcus anophagefferens]|nr:hypothetical protein JL721_6075 [Aureococcus anophagefferens]